MLQNSFYAISGTFYTLLNNTDLYLSYFILSYVFLGHNDSVEWGLTVPFKWTPLYRSLSLLRSLVVLMNNIFIERLSLSCVAFFITYLIGEMSEEGKNLGSQVTSWRSSTFLSYTYYLLSKARNRERRTDGDATHLTASCDLKWICLI